MAQGIGNTDPFQVALPSSGKPVLASVSTVEFSVVIPVYNDWTALDGSLRSLTTQIDAPNFEVIVVDDGSHYQGDDLARRWGQVMNIRSYRQVHLGVSAARNHGLSNARGKIVLFVDADCTLDRHCLKLLAEYLRSRPCVKAFQLNIRGDRSYLTGRTEALRLVALQKEKMLPDGRIKYLNTSGFAIRVDPGHPPPRLFDARAVRAQDTLLLAELSVRDESPYYVAEAMITHAIDPSLTKYLRKELKNSYLEGWAYRRIKAMAINVRFSNLDRWQRIKLRWTISRANHLGISAFGVLVLWHLMKFLGRVAGFMFPRNLPEI